MGVNGNTRIHTYTSSLLKKNPHFTDTLTTKNNAKKMNKKPEIPGAPELASVNARELLIGKTGQYPIDMFS